MGALELFDQLHQIAIKSIAARKVAIAVIAAAPAAELLTQASHQRTVHALAQIAHIPRAGVPQQHEVAEPITRELRDADAGGLGADLKLGRILVQAAQYHLRARSALITEHQNGRTVEQTQLRQRSALHQAVQTLR